MRNVTALLATLLLATPALAADPPIMVHAPLHGLSASLERELDRQLNKYVTYPLLERGHSMDGEVFVSFVIDAEGRVKVIDAQSRNTALCEYVLRMLAKVDVGDNPDGSWRTTHMRFTFHPEV